MADEQQPEGEITLDFWESLGDLALKVKEAYDRGEREIKVACHDFAFPDNVVMGGVWDSPVGPVVLADAIFQALKDVGGINAQGSLNAVPNPNYKLMTPYSMYLVFSL